MMGGEKLNCVKVKSESVFKNTDSWSAALFLSETSICTSINAFVSIPYISVIVMFVLLLSVLVIHKGVIRFDFKCVCFFLAAIISLLISAVLNGFSNIQEYFIYLIVFGTTSLLIAALDIDFQLVFLDTLKIYFFVIIIYFFKVRSMMQTSNDYWDIQMGIAYAYVAPFLFGIAFVLCYKRFFIEYSKMYYFIAWLEVAISVYIILFDCGTRGALVSAILGCYLIVFGLSSKNKRRIQILVIVIIAIILVYQMDTITFLLAKSFINSNIVALKKNAQMILMGAGDNGRNELFEKALEYFKKSPIVGNGVGYFEKNNKGAYVHQLFYQLLCEYGGLGFFIILLSTIPMLYRVLFSEPTTEKVFVTILIGISMILLYSNTYWLLVTFWFSFFSIILFKRR